MNLGSHSIHATRRIQIVIVLSFIHSYLLLTLLLLLIYRISHPPKCILFALLGARLTALWSLYLILLTKVHLSSVTDIIDIADTALNG